MILAGITIGTITGDNGIINKAQSAKEETEIANEKEVVEKATVQTMGNNKFGNVEKDGLQKELDRETGEGKTEVSEADEYFKVTFKDSERSYLVDKDGNVIDIPDRTGIEVGDYVNYVPDTETTEYGVDKLSADITGSSSNTNALTQDEGMTWRILNIRVNGTIELIGEPTEQRIYFNGALGYNNGVYVMNDICKTLYSNDLLGIEARSINIEDIENGYSQTGIDARNSYDTQGGQYGEIFTYKRTEKKYPMLYIQENGSGIDIKEGEDIKGQLRKDGVEKSESYYSKPTTEEAGEATNSLTVTKTYYIFNNPPVTYFKDYDQNTGKSIVKDILFDTGTQYWLASRSVDCGSEIVALFSLGGMSNSMLTHYNVFNSNGYVRNSGLYIRPIVTLEPDIQITPVDNPDGSSTENMHQISKK